VDYHQRINATKDLDEKRQILSEYFAKHPDDAHQPHSWGNTLKEIILEYAAGQGNLPEAVKMLPDNLSGIEKGNLYNTIAWGACLKDVHLAEAAALAKAGLDTLKAVELSGQGKPAMYTMPQYVRSVKLTYEQVADTYAFLLYKTGDYKQALAYEKIAMQEPDPQTEIISRYHLFMEKTDKPSHVVASLATYIEKGKSDSSMKAQYERLYKGKWQRDDAYAALEAKAKANKQAEMVKTILNESASKFTLLDMDGHKVSLDSLKGKTVVVDFWATWCGPCKASFPAMQKLVDHYKDDKNVAVLFVDTWETADDKKQNAQDFIKKSPYTFHVLLDNDSKVVTDYKVEGIPTKNPNGILRL
jgi:thiol-disulfide isomerase/thioredoxin